MINIKPLDNAIKSLEKESNCLEGKLSLLKEQHLDLIDKLDYLKQTQVINSKSVELLNFVQKATKEVICNIFESIVTKALQFIHQSDNYKFELEFGQRGNIPELNFNIKTPDMQESHSIMDTRGGGTADIVSLALRFVLLEISKTSGFVFFDEPFKHLDNEETIQKALEFVQETQRNTDRQIFLISHEQEIVEGVKKAIILQDIEEKETIKPNPQKKRGRPRKGEKNV